MLQHKLQNLIFIANEGSELYEQEDLGSEQYGIILVHTWMIRTW